MHCSVNLDTNNKTKMTDDDMKKLSRNDDYQLRVMTELFGVLQRDWEKFARESTIEYEVGKDQRQQSGGTDASGEELG